MVATIIGVGSAVIMAVLGAAFVQHARMARLEQKVEDIPKVINGSVLRTITDHCRTVQADCPARSEFIGAVRPQPLPQTER